MKNLLIVLILLITVFSGCDNPDNGDPVDTLGDIYWMTDINQGNHVFSLNRAELSEPIEVDVLFEPLDDDPPSNGRAFHSFIINVF